MLSAARIGSQDRQSNSVFHARVIHMCVCSLLKRSFPSSIKSRIFLVIISSCADKFLGVSKSFDVYLRDVTYVHMRDTRTRVEKHRREALLNISFVHTRARL